MVGPVLFPTAASEPSVSVLSYNVLLPNSVDGWWTYKMYLPPVWGTANEGIASWKHRQNLLRERIALVGKGHSMTCCRCCCFCRCGSLVFFAGAYVLTTARKNFPPSVVSWCLHAHNVGADVVCFQEVSPVSFDDDFMFMLELGYDGKEMFKSGRFRPATFWKTSRCHLVAPAVHKDRTLLTAFRIARSSSDEVDDDDDKSTSRIWYILNAHLQAGRQGSRRVRQIIEGCRAALTLARKLKGTSLV
jgi:hypothetical protein